MELRPYLESPVGQNNTPGSRVAQHGDNVARNHAALAVSFRLHFQLQFKGFCCLAVGWLMDTLAAAFGL